MPSLDLTQNIFNLNAGARFGDVAEVEAGASLDFRVSAELRRGIDLELGVGIMGEVEAGLSKFIAIDAEVRAEAMAGLRGQIQLPLDLFEEAGVAIRLRAIARAAIQGRLAIGLAMGDFLDLAIQDQRIDGIYLQLLTIFLEEAKAQVGVRGVASVAAKAYANLIITGRLIENAADGLEPGFNVSFDLGAGLKAGFAVGVFAEIGFQNPRRLIRRTVDLLVDESMDQIVERIDKTDQRARDLAYGLRVPTKLALRCGFEIGLSLSQQSGLFTDSGPELARRSVTVALEELQRFLLEEVSQYAIAAIQDALIAIGAAEDAWETSAPQRDHLIRTLRDMPDDPFELDAESAVYWGTVVNGAFGVVLAIGGNELVREEWAEPISLLWCSTQLLLTTVERTVDASARASFFGALNAEARLSAFEGQIVHTVPAPDLIRQVVNDRLGRSLDAEITQQEIANYVIQKGIDGLIVYRPAVRPVLEIIAGPDADADALAAAANTVLSNAGAFVPGPDGNVDPEASLRVLADGFVAYLDVRVHNELAPILHQAIADEPHLRLYVDEVMLPSITFVVDTVFDRVLDWSFGQIGHRDALREACSSIVMKVLGRSLVVTTDILVAHALTHLRGELLALAGSVGDPGGIADHLADSFDLDRELVEELSEETLLIAADVFGPLPPATRARIRALLYALLDPMPAHVEDDWIDQLFQDLFIPDAQSRQALMDLGGEMAGVMTDLVQRFVAQTLTRLAEIVMVEIGEFVDDVAVAVDEWLSELQGAINALAERLLDLPGEILDAIKRAADAIVDALDDISRFFELLASPTQSAELASGIRSTLRTSAIGALSQNPIYQPLPGFAKTIAEDAMDAALNVLVADDFVAPTLALLQPLDDLVGPLVDDAIEVLETLRETDPNADASEVVSAVLMDRIDQAVNDVLGPNPAFTLRFSFTYPNGIGGDISLDIELLSIPIPAASLLTAVRQALAVSLSLNEIIADAADHLLSAIAARDEQDALEIEEALASVEHDALTTQFNATLVGALDIHVLRPAPSSVHEDAVAIEVIVENAPQSFLGLYDDDVQRIYLFLNQQPIDLATVTVRETTPGKDKSPVGKRRSDIGDLKSNLVQTGSGFEIIDQKDRSGRLSEAAADRLQRLTGSDIRDLKAADMARMSRHRSLDLTWSKGAVATGAMMRFSMREGGGKMAMSASAARDPMLEGLGRARRLVLDSLEKPGLILTKTVVQSDLREGLNSLSAVVIDGRGQRRETTIVFVAKQQEQSDNTKVPPKLGRPPELTFDRLPKAVQRAMGLDHLATSLATTKATKGKAKQDGDPLWLPKKKERVKRLERHRKALIDKANKSTRNMSTVRRSVEDGRFRPTLRHGR